MRPQTVLVRDLQDRSLPPDVFVREHPRRGGQEARFRLTLRSRDAVEWARRAGVPVYLFHPSVARDLGYPLEFQPRLLVGKSVADALEETIFRPIVFRDEQAARAPTLEDLVVAMLRIDRLGARRLVRENLGSIDRPRLLKRILAEDAEVLASRVRLDEFVPGLPPAAPIPGWRISKEELAGQDRIDYGREADQRSRRAAALQALERRTAGASA